jgi:hypothetical protein
MKKKTTKQYLWQANMCTTLLGYEFGKPLISLITIPSLQETQMQMADYCSNGTTIYSGHCTLMLVHS